MDHFDSWEMYTTITHWDEWGQQNARLRERSEGSEEPLLDFKDAKSHGAQSGTKTNISEFGFRVGSKAVCKKYYATEGAARFYHAPSEIRFGGDLFRGEAAVTIFKLITKLMTKQHTPSGDGEMFEKNVFSDEFYQKRRAKAENLIAKFKDADGARSHITDEEIQQLIDGFKHDERRMRQMRWRLLHLQLRIAYSLASSEEKKVSTSASAAEKCSTHASIAQYLEEAKSAVDEEEEGGGAACAAAAASAEATTSMRKTTSPAGVDSDCRGGTQSVEYNLVMKKQNDLALLKAAKERIDFFTNPNSPDTSRLERSLLTL